MNSEENLAEEARTDEIETRKPSAASRQMTPYLTLLPNLLKFNLNFIWFNSIGDLNSQINGLKRELSKSKEEYRKLKSKYDMLQGNERIVSFNKTYF